MSEATLSICVTCGMKLRDADGNKLENPASHVLADEVGALLAGSGVEVRLVRCLSMCDYPIGWALQGEGRMTYAFAPASTAADLAAVAGAYVRAGKGQKIPKSEMPEEVKGTVRSKVPVLE
jgi:predicted metal-binding protein